MLLRSFTDRPDAACFLFLYTYLKNYADTEDAMQTVYLKVKLNINKYVGGTNGRAWLLQIAKNHALNELTKRKREAPMLDCAADETTYEMETAGAVSQIIHTALTDEEQKIVTLHVLWGVQASGNCKRAEFAHRYGDVQVQAQYNEIKKSDKGGRIMKSWKKLWKDELDKTVPELFQMNSFSSSPDKVDKFNSLVFPQSII